MFFGAISHQRFPSFKGLVNLKNLFKCGNDVFTEKHLPDMAAVWLNEAGRSLGCSFYFDQSSNWSIFVFGEFYDLKDQPENSPQGATLSTPRIILSLFHKHGVSFAEKLNGDFVIIISNAEEKTTYVYRDHMGIRPFSYTVLDQVLYYCSDTIALCRNFYPHEPVNPEFLLRDFKFTDNTITPNKNVTRLLPGHYLLIKNNVAEQHKYWFPEKIKPDNTYTAERVFREATALIEDAVEIRTDKRQIAASHLSGGLDSSAIAVLSRKHYPHQKIFYGFSWSPDFSLYATQGEKDERILIAKTCAETKIEPVFSSFSSDHFKNHYTEPIENSSFPHEQIVLEFARKNGVQLIFSGYGGDEFFSCGTYGVFIDLLRSLKWRKYWRVAKTWGPMTIMKSLVLDFLSPVFGVLPLSFHIQNRESTRFIRKPYKKNHQPSLKHFFLHKSRKDMHLGMLYHYHIPLRTEEWYNLSSKLGIQYRYPLLDKRMVEFMLKVPSDYLYKNSFGRVLLREAVKGKLPEEARWSASKTDPALFKYGDELAKAFVSDHFSQLEELKENPALAFFDFKKFEKAFSKASRSPQSNWNKSISANFIRLMWVHEFTKKYPQSFFTSEA